MRRGACNGRTWRRLGGVGAIWTMPGPPRPSAPPQIPVSTATDEPRPRSAGSEPPPRLELCQAARARLLDRDAGTGRRTRRPKRYGVGCQGPIWLSSFDARTVPGHTQSGDGTKPPFHSRTAACGLKALRYASTAPPRCCGLDPAARQCTTARGGSGPVFRSPDRPLPAALAYAASGAAASRRSAADVGSNICSFVTTAHAMRNNLRAAAQRATFGALPAPRNRV